MTEGRVLTGPCGVCGDVTEVIRVDGEALCANCQKGLVILAQQMPRCQSTYDKAGWVWTCEKPEAHDGRHVSASMVWGDR